MADPAQPDEAVTVTVTDRTGALVDVDRWAALVRDVLVDEGVVGPAEADVVFVGVDEIAELNAEHLGGDGPTDVLSFPIDDLERDAADQPADGTGVRFVGDIVVCAEVATANAPDHAGDPDDEIALLLVHATLHLLGHDHAEADERAAMWRAERRHLDRAWRPLARDPWVA